MADARLGIVVSADAKSASATFKELSADIKAVGKESVGVTEGVAKVDAALAKLARAPDTPMALARATAKVKLEVDELRAALDKTPASAEKMKAISAALAQADQAMQRSIQRAGKLGEAQEEIKQKMGLTAKGAESLGNSFGSLDGIMGKMADSSSGASQSIAKVGFSLMAVGTAFKFGYDTGTKFNKFLQDHGNYLEKAIDATVRFATAEKNARKDVSGLAADLDLESAAITDHTKALAGHIVARKAAANATKEADAAIKAAIPGWQSAAEQQKKLTEEIAKTAQKFADITKTGGDWRKEVEANQAPFAAWVAKLEAAKVPLSSLPPAIQDAIKYLKELKGATEDAATGIETLGKALEGLGKGGAADSIASVAAALAQIRAEGGSVGEAVAANAAGFQSLYDAAADSAEGLAKFRAEVMDQIPAYQATAMAEAQYAGSIDDIIAKTNEYEEARRRANEADHAAVESMTALRDNAAGVARSIDTIGEAWARATGQAAGFTVEVRHATQAVKETTPEFDAFIESLAVTSDEFERMTPYVGSLIKQLETGQINTDQFRQAIEGLQVGFMQIQGVSGQMFGDLDSLWAKLNALLNEFTRKGK